MEGNGPLVRCTCSRCTRARRRSELIAAAGVVRLCILVAVVIGVCLFFAGCSLQPVSECENGYSWRGDCNQRLFIQE